MGKRDLIEKMRRSKQERHEVRRATRQQESDRTGISSSFLFKRKRRRRVPRLFNLPVLPAIYVPNELGFVTVRSKLSIISYGGGYNEHGPTDLLATISPEL